jgi:UDP-N-acetyl-D-glucosamine dehydrogenase
MPHYPSAGIGGHCIPVVPHFLEAAARQVGLQTELIDAAERVNQMMPRLMVDKIEAALTARGKRMANARLLLVGVTYKPDTADVRESAAVQIFEEAVLRGAVVTYHDPLIAQLEAAGRSVSGVPLTASTIASADAVVLLTPHSTFDYDLILHKAQLVVDTHGGLYPRVGPNVVNVWTAHPAVAHVSKMRPAA